MFEGYFIGFPTASELADATHNQTFAEVAKVGPIPMHGQATIKAAGVNVGRIMVEALPSPRPCGLTIRASGPR
jgi:hypothetical protein